MTSSLWIVGPPGVGKTTLARQILGTVHALVPRPKLTLAAQWVAAGHYSGATFDGADTVPYNGAAQVLDLWTERFFNLPLLLDGDRFSNAACVGRVRRAGARTVCLLLDATDEVLAHRRALRGSHQDPIWLAGRATKARRFFQLFEEGERLSVDASDLVALQRAQEWARAFVGEVHAK